MSFNKVILIGNVGKDPEVRHLETGAAVASFTLATTERYKNKNGELQDQTEWHNIVCWRNLAELSEKYIKKGTKVFIAGTLEDNTYEKDGQSKTVEFVLAQEVEILTKADDKERTSTTTGATDTSNPPAETDDLPF